ncbi:transmembrane protein 130-like [Tachypleus tridentatus]|uniref:transmembrane protein 130-like n=1 Tax=Tachypleus tridentatus TaxID=6853 RepID=UPI003FD307D1
MSKLFYELKTLSQFVVALVLVYLNAKTAFLLSLTVSVLQTRTVAEFLQPSTTRSMVETNSGVKVSNDGPAVFGSVLTFTAELDNNTGIGDEYRYIFIHNAKCAGRHRHSIRASRKANLSLLFQDEDCEKGSYFMTVTVYEDRSYVLNKKVAFGKTTFVLTNELVGNITVNQDVESEQESDLPLLSTEEETNLTATLHDPSGFLDDAIISYSWNIDGYNIIDAGPTLIYNFSRPGRHEIDVTVVAFIPSVSQTQNKTNLSFRSHTRWGFLSQQVIAKDPIGNINVDGNLYLEHGDLLILEVSCNGSGPYEYCWKVYDTGELPVNLTCPEPVVTSNCSFPIVHYFSNPGLYHIGMYIANDVAHLQKGVDVQIYDISRKKQLSVVIVPVSCTVLTIIIIVTGVAYHLQQRNKQKIEVADFDFQKPDELLEKTFYERLRDSFKEVFYNTQQHSGKTFKTVSPKNGHVTVEDATIIDSNSSDIHSSYGTIA